VNCEADEFVGLSYNTRLWVFCLSVCGICVPDLVLALYFKDPFGKVETRQTELARSGQVRSGHRLGRLDSDSESRRRQCARSPAYCSAIRFTRRFNNTVTTSAATPLSRRRRRRRPRRIGRNIALACKSCNGHRPAGSVEPLLFPGRPWCRQWGRCAKPTLQRSNRKRQIADFSLVELNLGQPPS
jgi:hypothetical protein